MKNLNETEVSNYEFLARNIYYTSQYSNSSGLKKNFLYPKYKKESRDFPGRHTCRVSIQRLCSGKWKGVAESAIKTKSESQELKGFCIAPGALVRKYGFDLEPASNKRNPYHGHIVIPELDLPYPTSDEDLGSVMSAGLKRRLDALSEEFEYISIEELSTKNAHCYSPSCLSCLNGEKQ